MASILKKRLNVAARNAIYLFAAPMMDARPERATLEEARKTLSLAVRKHGASLWKGPGHLGTLKQYGLTDTYTTLSIEYDHGADKDLEYSHVFQAPLWEEGQEEWNPAKGLQVGYLLLARTSTTVGNWRQCQRKYEGSGRTAAERAGSAHRPVCNTGIEVPSTPTRHRRALTSECPVEKHQFLVAYEAWEAAWLANLGMLHKALLACTTWEDVVKTIPQVAALPGWRGFYTQQLAPTTALVPSQEFYDQVKALPFVPDTTAVEANSHKEDTDNE